MKVKKDKKYKWDRVSAYLVDLLIVVTLATLLVNNSFTNPFYNNFKEAENAYKEVYSTVMKDLDLSNSEAVMNACKTLAQPYRTYIIRSSFAFSLWYVILTVFYFGLFAYFNDGQTLGKKFWRLKVISNDDKSASFFQLCIRNIFGGNRMLCGTNICILLTIFLPFIKDPLSFLITYNIILLLGVILDIVFILIFLFNKNGRTLDDFVGKTKVVRVEKKRVSKIN